MNAPREAQPPDGRVRGAPGADLFLLPGHWWYGNDAGVVRTLLGSCVAVTLWHPRWRIGAMCHYLLPDRPRRGATGLDGRYGDEAIELLRRCVLTAGLPPGEFEARVFGGGTMFVAGEAGRREAGRLDIGPRNVAMARERLAAAGFGRFSEDVGGVQPLHVELQLATGRVLTRAGG